MAGVDKALVFTIVLYAVCAGTWLVGYWLPDAESLSAPPHESVVGNQTDSAPVATSDKVNIEPENGFLGWVSFLGYLVGAGFAVSTGIYFAKKFEKWRLLLTLSIIQIVVALAWLAAAAFDIMNTINLLPKVLQICGVAGGVLLAGLNSAFGFILFKENKASPAKYTIFLDDFNDLDDEEEDELLSNIDS